MEKFYTYLWLREDGTPYYAGKGSGRRGLDSDGHLVNRPKDKTNILIQYFPTEADAFFAEKYLIAYYGRIDNGTGILRNRTDGGENPPKNYGKRPESFSKLLSELLTGRIGGMTGKRHSPETLEKMRKAHLGNRGRTGQHLSEEHKRKIGNANRGTYHVKNSHSGNKLSPGCS